MTPISQPTFSPGTFNVVGSPNIEITNVDLTTANTEYSHILQTDVSQIRIRCREYATLKVAFVSGETSTKFWTIPSGTCDTIDGLTFNGTLYLQSNKSSVTVEVMEIY